MEAKELRIGNYYLSTKFQVPVKIGIDDFNELYARCDGAELDSDIIDDMFEPIPISEELLKRAGFKKTNEFGGNGFRLGNFIIFKVHSNARSEDWFYEVEYTSSDDFSDRINIKKRIDFFHQLQNIYFALPGEELTIKL